MDFIFDEEKHQFIVNGDQVWPSVTQTLVDGGFIDRTWFTEYACNRGTLIHRIIQWHLEGCLDIDTIDPALLPYYAAWLKFEQDTGYQAIEIEKPRINEIWKFGGIPDNIGVLNGHSIILDIKSGALMPATQLQLAGYRSLIGNPTVSKRFALQLTNAGKFKLTEFKDRDDHNIFHAALACFWWKRTHNIKGGNNEIRKD